MPEEFEGDAREELSFAWLIAKQACLYHWTAEAERQVPALAGSARPFAEAHHRIEKGYQLSECPNTERNQGCERPELPLESMGSEVRPIEIRAGRGRNERVRDRNQG